MRDLTLLQISSVTSKKPASSKRASIPRRSDYTKTFAKDWVRLSRSGRYDMHLLKEVMGLLIANDAPLPPEWLDHERSKTDTLAFSYAQLPNYAQYPSPTLAPQLPLLRAVCL